MKQRKKLGRKILGVLITLAMIIGLMPGMSLTAYAAGASYVDGSGTTQTVDATELATSTTSWTDGSWYGGIVTATGGNGASANGTGIQGGGGVTRVTAGAGGTVSIYLVQVSRLQIPFSSISSDLS